MVTPVKLGKYWICDECAKEKGGTIRNRICTVAHGTCSWCSGKKQLYIYVTPIRDFNWADGRPDEVKRRKKK